MMLIPSIIAFFVSVTSAILVQKLFFVQNKIDSINHRSSHSVLATRTGGISIFLALSASTFYFYFQGEQPYDFSILIPLGIMFVIGIYDDFYNADFKLKFFIQIIVAKILIDQGLIISNFYGVFGLFELPRFTAQLFTVFVFLVIVNAINFIDGIDGLAISLFFKFLILYEWINNDNQSLVLTSILISSLIPLYYFNYRNNKKVFLGDAGSLLLGTLVSIHIFNILNPTFQLNIFSQNSKPYIAILLILYPLADLLRVFLIRVLAKKSPFIADQNHLHHVLHRFWGNHLLVVISIIFIEILVFLCVYLQSLLK